MRNLRAALLLLIAASAFAFDAQHAYDLAQELGSDRFEGRRSGHPGGTRAEEFIADYCREIGVSPAGKDGYFQEVPLLVTEEHGASLSIMGSELGKVTFLHGLDFTLNTHSGSGSFVRDIVIAGHGIVNAEKGRDDYGELDVRGKIVVIVRGEPKSPYSFEEENSRYHTLKNAQERGAAAVLWHAASMPLNGAAISAELYDPDLPLFYIGDRVLQVVLEGTGYSMATYKSAIDKAPLPLKTNKQAAVSARVTKRGKQAARNVIGMVYGTDAVLRNEIVVVGAHLDHCGTNANGVVYNGAGDNASGSALIAELANAIAHGPALKRSVMFIWFAAEEDGLKGSYYFAENPTIPFGNIVAMLNFDMVGQGDGGATLVGLELLGKTGKEFADSLRQLDKPLKIRTANGNASSDYAPFIEGGAPGVAFFSSGEHPFYHHFSDDGQWLNPESFAAVGSAAESLVRDLGSQSASLASRSDTARVLARMATTIDVDGFFVDAHGTVKTSDVIQLAWLSYDNRTGFQDLISGCASLHAYCNAHKIVSDGLKSAVDARRDMRSGVALAVPEIGLSTRTVPELVALTKLGLSVVHLTPEQGAPKSRLSDEAFDVLQTAGVFALIPLDFNTASRVQRWGSHSIVTASLAQFAATPAEIREPLLTSDALLLLDVDSAPTAEQLETIRAGRERFVHLNFGESYDDLRESDQKVAIKTLLSQNFTRDEVLFLTGKNLRRFLEQ
ncbi:MAG: M28 family peptidase [Calditrichaeota bacterium]|nr:M28 family peptidase [Calditrichota bacterium]